MAPPPATNTHVHIALATIAASLPEAISHKVPANSEQFVPIPVEKILPQLAHGQVVMTAAELRECAPDYFSALAGHDDIPVTLPLGDIVSQLSPQLFGRRSQRQLDVPTDVGPVFAAGGNGLSMAKPAAPQTAPVSRVQPTATSTTPAPAPAAPQTPAGRIAMSAQALASLGGKAPAPAPMPTRPATVPAPKPPISMPAATPTTAAPTLPAATFSRAPVTVPKRPSAPAKITGELAVPLSAVCTEWIDEVQTQLIDVDVEQSQILVPLELLAPMMKSGRILFSWQEVASWIQPPLASPPTPKVGEMPVELPLKVVAPLFMAHHRGTGQKRVAVDESIPDLFSGGDASTAVQAQMAPAPAPATPAPAAAPVAPATPQVRSTPAPVVTTPALQMVPPVATRPEPAPSVLQMTSPAPQAASASSSDQPQFSVEQVIGPANARVGAKEIVAKAARLPGVGGALLAMNDGLLVTSQVPAAFKAETIAAFLPQMFGRMTQYTKELSLGALDRITLSVEGGEWHVFKLPNIYFAVLGKRGESLSLNLLAQVAVELSSQSK